MSKSTLSIIVATEREGGTARRIVEVPCRLPDSFTFWFHLPGYGKAKATALLHDYDEPKAVMVGEVEIEVGTDRDSPGPIDTAHRAADLVFGDIKNHLGLGALEYTSVSQTLALIALAYEAEVAAYEAAVKAHAALPRALHSPALLPPHPSERAHCYPVLMLARYVEHVVEQACKAQTERAEAQAKVTS